MEALGGGPWFSCLYVTVVGRDLPVGETSSEVGNCWYPEVVAQAQRDDPDIRVVLCRVLKEWRKPAVEELHANGLCSSCCLGPV